MSVTAEITETYKPPSGVDAHFYEPFQDSDWTERWIHSSLEKYCGNFVVEHPPFDFIRQGDHALVAKDGGCHHAISHQLMDPFEIVNGTLVLQFEVLLQQKVECGGAYIKLMAEDENFHAENFDNRSPYLIMFGPDRCGTDGQVLFIFRHRHPITGVWSEKRMVNPPKIKGDLKPHIYTLHLKGNNSFDIFIDQERIRSGSLLLDFSPSVNPPREVADPTDVMPTDLRHNPIIPDLSVTKPDDWDENAPHEIPDPTAQKPDDWDESIPLLISDPSASRPVGWSTILQGPWTPPFILNPLCPTRRCGPWMPPMVANPAYKGKWSHPLIENPAYVGEWQPRLIPNPDYVEDLNPSQFLPIGSIGIEIWTTTPGISFDNLFLGNNLEAAQNLSDATFAAKKRFSRNGSANVEEEASDVENERTYLEKAILYAHDNPLGFAGVVFLLAVPLGMIFTPPTDRISVRRRAQEEQERRRHLNRNVDGDVAVDGFPVDQIIEDMAPNLEG